MDIATEDVKQYLRSLSPAELAELFYDAFLLRNVSDEPETGSREHLLLGLAYTFGDSDEGWNVELIAPTDRRIQPWDGPSPPDLIQSGSCQRCRSGAVVCWSKSAICPVCGGPVGCT